MCVSEAELWKSRKGSKLGSYENATVAIKKVAKQLIHTAILFDSLHEQKRFVSWEDYEQLFENGNDEIFRIEEESIQFIGDLSSPSWTSMALSSPT